MKGPYIELELSSKMPLIRY